MLNFAEAVIARADFHIFRDTKRRAPASELMGALRRELFRLPSQVQEADLLSLLLRAGELECALADAGRGANDSGCSSRLTNLFAGYAVASDKTQRVYHAHQLCSVALPLLDGITCRDELTYSVPEGFAYYALHLLDYADALTRACVSAPCAFVVGLRSIGTTLSAVVAAKLRLLGIPAQRTTVRPVGHPYDRYCQFASEQKLAISTALARNSAFIICDEGPGRSGSSLISLAEALERELVPADRILILCSHQPDVGSLCASEAARRWSRYRSIATGMTKRLPDDAAEFVGGGEWRKHFIPTGEPWPAAWPQMERLKYLSQDGQAIWRFEGHGHYGEEVRAREEALCARGFGAEYLGHSAGFGQHRLLAGRSMARHEVTLGLLTHMAEYCAWRSQEFPASIASHELESMARINFEREFGRAPADLTLAVERPAVCDGRMQPQERVRTNNGRWIKLDATTHGDDHFFPGPCDIAWDLAGTIVEWGLDTHAREAFLATYQRISGDNTLRRMPAYEIAYATFRMAWSAMAAASVIGTEEEARLLRDYERYREVAEATERRNGSGHRQPAAASALQLPHLL